MVSCFVDFGTHPFILVCPNLYLSMDDKMNLKKNMFKVEYRLPEYKSHWTFSSFKLS